MLPLLKFALRITSALFTILNFFEIFLYIGFCKCFALCDSPYDFLNKCCCGVILEYRKRLILIDIDTFAGTYIKQRFKSCNIGYIAKSILCRGIRGMCVRVQTIETNTYATCLACLDGYVNIFNQKSVLVC